MKKGFTLIEVLVVAVIVAILAAVAIPAYNAYRYGRIIYNADYEIILKSDVTINFRNTERVCRELYFSKFDMDDYAINIIDDIYGERYQIPKNNIISFLPNPNRKEKKRVNVPDWKIIPKDKIEEIQTIPVANNTDYIKRIVEDAFDMKLIIHLTDGTTITVLCDSYDEEFGGGVKCYKGTDYDKILIREFKKLDYSYIEIKYLEFK